MDKSKLQETIKKLEAALSRGGIRNEQQIRDSIKAKKRILANMSGEDKITFKRDKKMTEAVSTATPKVISKYEMKPIKSKWRSLKSLFESKVSKEAKKAKRSRSN